MTLRWSELAVEDLESIRDFIAQDNRDAAAATVEHLVKAAERLERHPELGRPGRFKGTRQLICPPYLIVNRIQKEVIEILNVFHGSRRHPYGEPLA